MSREKMRDRFGLALFTFAAVLSALSAWKVPSVLAWLTVVHNIILAGVYARRRPARAYDRMGLWLGAAAALLPATVTYTASSLWWATLIGVMGYGMVLWSLLTLRSRFGVAPADRGLVTSGPYRLVRHPMYLGELALRGALAAASPTPLSAALLLLVLALIQATRILREERIIAGYPGYAAGVRYRLVPGVW